MPLIQSFKKKGAGAMMIIKMNKRVAPSTKIDGNSTQRAKNTTDSFNTTHSQVYCLHTECGLMDRRAKP